MNFARESIQELAPVTGEDFDQMISTVDSQFREYMHAHQVLSTLPESVLRKYKRKLQNRPRMTREEKELSHSLIAALFTYQQDAVACAKSGADFASGLMAFATCEVTAIFQLLWEKKKVRQTRFFKKLWRAAVRRKKQTASTITYGKFLFELRTEDLFRLARDAEIYDERCLPSQVAEALQMRGFQGKLTEFVRKSRNCVHPRRNLEANDRYAKLLDVFYSPEMMKSFHIDFALCAWELHGRLNRTLEPIGQIGLQQ